MTAIAAAAAWTVKLARPGSAEFATWPWQRCRARLPRRVTSPYWGRCDLRRNHSTDHALERGFDCVWFTDEQAAR